MLESPSRRSCYLKVKNAHLMRKPRLAGFPDGVTESGAEELDALAAALDSGARAVLLYVIQIASTDRFAIARDIDPAYAAAFERARAQGGADAGVALRCQPRRHRDRGAGPDHRRLGGCAPGARIA
ncbi:MAG TPA: DNA/RNA nuclease SfsA [Xanthobacteraceae bacterium]|nr:DNA/RNA nuclease SfsA [Xanthobacteraceae bacterium]